MALDTGLIGLSLLVLVGVGPVWGQRGDAMDTGGDCQSQTEQKTYEQDFFHEFPRDGLYG